MYKSNFGKKLQKIHKFFIPLSVIPSALAVNRISLNTVNLNNKKRKY